ncbi:hypothetical protein J2W42_000496 [Rhizobium tibeticum]|nr:hypothetical protein [Rhizobium tibeticum]
MRAGRWRVLNVAGDVLYCAPAFSNHALYPFHPHPGVLRRSLEGSGRPLAGPLMSYSCRIWVASERRRARLHMQTDEKSLGGAIL